MQYEKYSKWSEVAQGKLEADIVVKNGFVLDVFNEKWLQKDLVICDGLIVGVGEYKGKKEIDGTGKYVVPGFIDSHLHLESTLVNPSELIYAAAQSGTTTFVVDPHEAANVSGIAGVEYIIDATNDVQANVYVMAPSCVPAIPGEDNGAIMNAEELAKLKENPRILGLGEVMDCFGVIQANPDMIAKLEVFQDRVMDGHFVGLSEEQLNAYVLAGIQTNHEAGTYEDASLQVEKGMHVFIREGSAARNLDTIVQGIVKNQTATEFYGFCTDDKHIEDIMTSGHISYNVRRSIELGIPTIKAYKMATLNSAQCYGFKHLGALAPGCQADFIVLDNADTVKINQVYFKGEPLHCHTVTPHPVPTALLQTINIGDFSLNNLQLLSTGTSDMIMEIVPGEIITRRVVENVPAENGLFVANQTYNKICCIERHKATGRSGVGIVKGFNLKNGAIATSFAHDAHNVIVVGDSDADMLLSVEELTKMGGGYVIISNGKVIDCLPLEIMGLITNVSHTVVDKKIEEMKHIAYQMGVPSVLDPFINLSFLALTVIPEIRITTRGMVLVGS